MNNAKKSLVPHRRFKEFQNAGAWEQRKLGEMVERETCQVISSDNNPSVEYDDVVSEQGKLNKDVLAKRSVKKGIQFNKNHILYGKLRPYLHNWLNPNFKGVAVGDWWVLKPKNDIKRAFLYALIQTQRYDNVANISTGSKMPRADWNLVSNTNFAIPSQLDEQLKIGEVFSQLDSLIALHQRKLNKLKKLKSAYLTEMFPDEGEHKPKRRFAGFTDDWEQRKLGDVVERFDNLRIPVTSSKRKRGITPYYGANGIQDYVQGYTHDGEFVLVAEDGANDLQNYPIHYVNGKVWVNNHAHVLQGKKDIADNLFLVNAIKRIKFETYLVGGSRAKLNADVMMKLPIKMPKLNEQQKLGKYFSRIDTLIALHQRELKCIVNTFILTNT